MTCSSIDSFADGTLTAAEIAAFCEHLKDCPQCQEELHDLMQLAMSMDGLRRSWWRRVRRWVRGMVGR